MIETSQPYAPTARAARRRRRITAAILVFSVLGSMLHQAGPLFKWEGWLLAKVDWRLWEWYIEDAAISFAYARNWAMGDGLVVFPGGERIEGYSNPLWVALMAVWYLFGVDGFLSSKLMSMAFGAATILISWRIAVDVIDDEESWAPLVAPVVLAATPQFAFWNASGLENSLFNLMLAGGVWRTLVEARKGGFPWSSVFFLGLAVTRPEAIMYSAWGGFLGMVFALRAGRGIRPTIVWLLTFFVPFTAYHAIRYDYFAWAFPNTYYAKLGHKTFRPFAWKSGGWKYLRNFAHDTNGGYFLPVYVLGLVGLQRHRKWLYAAGVSMLAILFCYPGTETLLETSWWPKDLPEPGWWQEGRVWGLLGLALALPLASLGGRGWRGRVMLWGMACITFFFCIRSGGDWMKGFRWMSFVAVPGAVLFAAGVDEVARVAQRYLGRSERPGWTIPSILVTALLVGALLPGWYLHSEWFFKKRETGPFSVQKRVEYSESIMQRVFAEGPIWNLDVDMGAHLYWSKHHMVDMAGLVDTPIAHHDFGQRVFTKEYVFKERKPQFAHVHGGWASNSKIPTFPDWERDYVEIPGYPVSRKTLHVGNHIRRDLLMKPRWRGPRDRQVPFEGNVALAGWTIASDRVSVGKSFFIEVGFRATSSVEVQDVRLVVFLSNEAGGLHAFEVPLGYDWLKPSAWRIDEVFVGRYAPMLAKNLEPGEYDLGFVVMAADGSILKAAPDDVEGDPFPLPEGVVVGGRDGVEARYMDGELRFRGGIVIGGPGTGEKGARSALAASLKAAGAGECPAAERHWRQAWRYIPRAKQWRNKNEGNVAEVLSDCWVQTASNADRDEDKAAALTQARFWNHRSPTLHAAAGRIGTELYDTAMAAKAEGNWAAAYEGFDRAVRANPAMSWARREAEEARDRRLKIDPDTKARLAREREQRMERLREKREAEQAAKKAAAAGPGEALEDDELVEDDSDEGEKPGEGDDEGEVDGADKIKNAVKAVKKAAEGAKKGDLTVGAAEAGGGSAE